MFVIKVENFFVYHFSQETLNDFSLFSYAD